MALAPCYGFLALKVLSLQLYCPSTVLGGSLSHCALLTTLGGQPYSTSVLFSLHKGPSQDTRFQDSQGLVLRNSRMALLTVDLR